MYFGEISDKDVAIFHNTEKSNLNILLVDILENKLFYVEEMLEKKLYKIIPLFYCDKITSTNPNDKILENRCAICEFKPNTVLNFNAMNNVNDFDFTFSLNKIGDSFFFDFIFYDVVTMARLSDVEIKIEHLDKNNNVLSSEDYCSNSNGVFVYKFSLNEEVSRILYTFKHGNLVKQFW